MMKEFKKNVSIIVVLAMLVAMMAGCGSAENGIIETTTPIVETTEAITGGSVEAAEATDPSGETVSVTEPSSAVDPTVATSVVTEPTAPTESSGATTPAVQPTEATTKPTESKADPTEATTKPTESKANPTEATTKPTEAPTTPTVAPTTAPTEAPTTPTVAPTTEPTTAPTTAPTEPAHVHSYTSAVTKEATCCETGVKTYTCSCGASYTESIPVEAHNWKCVHHEAEYHYEDVLLICRCGWSMLISEMEATGYDYGEYWYFFHVKGERDHSYTTRGVNKIIDVPAYDEWVCTDCGKTTLEDPT